MNYQIQALFNHLEVVWPSTYSKETRTRRQSDHFLLHPSGAHILRARRHHLFDPQSNINHPLRPLRVCEYVIEVGINGVELLVAPFVSGPSLPCLTTVAYACGHLSLTRTRILLPIALL